MRWDSSLFPAKVADELISYMKAKFAIILLAALAASPVLATTPSSLQTTDGTTYNHISNLRADPDGLYIEYIIPGGGFGSAKVKFGRLSTDLQKQYGYDSDAAKKFEDDNYKASVAYRAWADQQDAIHQKAMADMAARDFQEEIILAQRPPMLPVVDQPAGDSSGSGYLDSYAGGYPFGLLAPRNAWTGSTFRGMVPQDQLFTPLGFNPNKTQAIPATLRNHGPGANRGDLR